MLYTLGAWLDASSEWRLLSGDFGGDAWTVAGCGDFDGDGRDDLVLFHQATGTLVLLADGDVDDWTAIGQLDASDWFTAGCGDYDCDGADDLLVRQTSTGLLGYYASGDVSKWTELGEVDASWTVIA